MQGSEGVAIVTPGAKARMPRPLPDQQAAMRRGRAKTTRPKELEGRPVVYVGHPNATDVEPPSVELGLGDEKFGR